MHKSHIHVSFDVPAYAANVVGLGALNVLATAGQFNKMKKTLHLGNLTAKAIARLPKDIPTLSQINH